MNKCSIVKDLFTTYVSGLGSDDTKALVEEHIAACDDCQSKLTEIQNRVAAQLHEKDAKSINIFKTMKKKILRRNILVAVGTTAVVAVFALFVGAKLIDQTPIAYHDGLVKVQVNYADYYKNDDNISVVITDPTGDHANVVDVESKSPMNSGKMAVLDITCTQNYYSIKSTGRTIIRDGEKIHVEYTCYTENALTKMQPDKQKKEQIFRLVHADLSEAAPTRYEVYYITNPALANTKSDNEFDNYRHNGTLLWSGTLD